eukprot:TRINITY_DN9679_c0_g1_i3.p3 TRINITY_DN9679_c0_g1~~TRINITY_DN9679_c0_g1_i3.p3  ORF type:complete len:106 (-),score=4.43 TRINITY_DN9679_c0_g1_i3:155-472(-)
MHRYYWTKLNSKFLYVKDAKNQRRLDPYLAQERVPYYGFSMYEDGKMTVIFNQIIVQDNTRLLEKSTLGAYKQYDQSRIRSSSLQEIMEFLRNNFFENDLLRIGI